MSKKGITTIRDNLVVYLLNHLGWKQGAFAYNWATTELTDTIGLMVAGKIGVTTLQGKFLILLIVSFII